MPKLCVKSMDVPYYRFSPRLPEVINLAECEQREAGRYDVLGLAIYSEDCKGNRCEVARRLLTRNKQ